MKPSRVLFSLLPLTAIGCSGSIDVITATPGTDAPTTNSPTPPPTPGVEPSPTVEPATPEPTEPEPTDEATRPPRTPRPTEPPTDTPAPVTPTQVEATPTPEVGPSYRATVRITTNGIPHVLAADLGSAAFGQGYFQAKNYICVLADQIVKVRSERAQYFGAGEADAHINSDHAWLALGVYEDAEQGWATLSADSRAAIQGFADGYNAYLQDVGRSGLPQECRGAGWVNTLSAVDLLAYYLSAAVVASGAQLIPYVLATAPPGQEAAAPAPATPPSLRGLPLGSNGWGLGAEKTATGRGLLAGNPHFPWEGELRFYEAHLTVPGKLNVYGAGLLGMPGVNIGFNDHLAWTHTVTYASHATLYRLTLDPRNPMRYKYDAGFRDIEARSYPIKVKQASGQLTTVTRTSWFTHWGPIVELEPLFAWNTLQATTFRDANENNLALVEQFLQMNQASDLTSFQDVYKEVGGIPWVHTMYADEDGNSFYVDGSSVPNLSDETLAVWQGALEGGDVQTVAAWELGAPLLDGSTSANEWVEDPASPRPGLVPYRDAPRMERSDFVTNANDNHWLTNPLEPLEGYPLTYQEERAPRSPRTRMSVSYLVESGEGTAPGVDGLFTVDELADMVMSNRGMMAELLQAQVAQRCLDVTTVIWEGEPVDIRDTCIAISNWDGRLDPRSRGALPWREFLAAFDSAAWYDAGDLFAVPFNANDPVTTPNTLAPPPESGPDTVLQALAAATTRLAAAGLDPLTELGDAQFTLKGEEAIPIHGGMGFEGATNITNYSTFGNTTLLPAMPRAPVINGTSDLTQDGYLINYGSSFMIVVGFTDEGPDARARMTYSQSADAASPWFSDQTHEYADKEWRQVVFSEEEILADPELVIYELGDGGLLE